MTYLQLADSISRMTKEQAYSDVTIHLSSKDEYYKVEHIEITDDNEEDRLDDGHPVLIIGDDWK
jgi:hypothetical protein